MDTWTIIIMVALFLVGIGLGYFIREQRRHLVSYYKDVKGEVQEVWGDSKEQFLKGLKEHEDTISHLYIERDEFMKQRDQLSKQLKDWNEWWDKHTDGDK